MRDESNQDFSKDQTVKIITNKNVQKNLCHNYATQQHRGFEDQHKIIKYSHEGTICRLSALNGLDYCYRRGGRRKKACRRYIVRRDF